ncbi:hypothetical protein PanWU01x14_062230 [Parasponia andersonii]|uniref:Uncharacterized protein n=1 Tax=Parasponia andersonii TaxID=3476 RepID=A0A2P5DHG9_PARAD|nr:hypothetical protein PanWU01x14_062230 [Parasponia andersonii]
MEGALASVNFLEVLNLETTFAVSFFPMVLVFKALSVVAENSIRESFASELENITNKFEDKSAEDRIRVNPRQRCKE